MSSALFGSSKQTASIPAWLEEPTKQMLDKSMAMSEVGYQPWMGPDVAALSPQERAAMENTAGAANAFGMSTPEVGGMTGPQPAPVNPADYGEDAAKVERIANAYRDVLGRDPDQAGLDYWRNNFDEANFDAAFRSGINEPARVDTLTGLPEPEQFGNVLGYSSAPLFNQAKEAFAQAQPGTADHYNQFFVDPQTGEAGKYTFATNGMNQQAAQAAQIAQGQGGGPDHYGGFSHGNPTGTNGGIFGGYTGIGDMFDGGGAGKSGNTFGGMFGGVSSGVGATPGNFFGGLF